MVFNFTPERTALNFGPRHHARWSSRQFLLWPAWSYRVVAPRVKPRELNTLQRAIMGLCRAGLYRTEEIAEHLAVHVDLVAFIITELTALRYLDSQVVPTDYGLRVFEEDSLEAQEMVAGYVFQDPWNGDLWPRFVESLDYCELEFNENGFPSLLLGPTGRPKRFRTFTVLPRSEVVPITPSASAIVEAVNRHRTGLRFIDADENDEEPLGQFAASGVQISRVSFVEEEPQPVFLMTYLYVPESDAGVMDWYACDPFGFGQSVRLRRRVEAIMYDVPGLFGVVNRLIGDTLHADYEEQRHWLEVLEFKAGLEVERRLSVNIRTHPSFEYLLAMESSRQEVQSLGEDCPERKVNELLRSGVKVLESTFSSIANAFPFNDIWKRVYVQRPGNQHLTQQSDRSLLSALYEGAFREVGFSDPIPSSFLNVKPGQVRSVAEFGKHWRLRPLITTMALLAQRDLSHPFHEAAKREPKLLVLIDEVANTGGRAGHAEGTKTSMKMVEEHVSKVYAIVSTLVGTVDTKISSSKNNAGDIDG